MGRFPSKTLRVPSEFYVSQRFPKTVQLREMAASAICSAKEVPQMAARDDVAGLKPSETTRICIYLWCVYL